MTSEFDQSMMLESQIIAKFQLLWLLLYHLSLHLPSLKVRIRLRSRFNGSCQSMMAAHRSLATKYFGTKVEKETILSRFLIAALTF